MSRGNTFEQYGLHQAAPGPTPFDSLRVDPLRYTEHQLDRDSNVRPVVSGEVFPRGIYRLLPGLGIVPQRGAIPDRFMQVYQPFNVLLGHGFSWNATKGPIASPITGGSVRLPAAAEDADQRIWRVFGDQRDEGLRICLDVGTYRPDLVVRQSLLPSRDNEPARRIFDMAQRGKLPTKPTAVPKAIEAQPKTPSKPALKAEQPERKPRSKTLPPRQKSFEFPFSTPDTAMSAHLVTVPQTPEAPPFPGISRPKAGDTGQVPLKRKQVEGSQEPLAFDGASKERGFWKLPPHIADFWNIKIGDEKPNQKIPVIVRHKTWGVMLFLPMNKPIRRVEGYPKGVGVDEYPDLDVFDRGGVLANQTCFIPSAGSSHEGIVYPVNGSCSVCVVVPNHAGEYDFSDGKNRGPIPAGSTVIRREDKLLCEFDPIDDPNTRYATYHLFAPGSRGAAVSNLSPQEAQKQFMNHHYRVEDRKRRKQDRLKGAGTVFSMRF